MVLASYVFSTLPSSLSSGGSSNASEHATHDQHKGNQTDDDACRQQHHCDAHCQGEDVNAGRLVDGDVVFCELQSR